MFNIHVRWSQERETVKDFGIVNSQRQLLHFYLSFISVMQNNLCQSRYILFYFSGCFSLSHTQTHTHTITITFKHHWVGKILGNPLQYLAWRILWTEETGGLQSMGSQRVGQAWATNTFTFYSGDIIGRICTKCLKRQKKFILPGQVRNNLKGKVIFG